MAARKLINVPDFLNIVDANVPAGTTYWRLSRVECWDNERSNGGRYVYTYQPYDASVCMVLDDGKRAQRIHLDRPETSASSYTSIATGKAYTAYIEGAPSDRVEGIVADPDGVMSYLFWWTEVDGGETLEEMLLRLGEEMRVLELNPQAALLRTIQRDGFLPTSEEIPLERDGIYYTAQNAERISDGQVRVYYVQHGDWNNVKMVEQ